MKNIIVISGHTDLATSVANKTILDTLAQELPDAGIVKLDSLYPDFNIDVEAEQQRLLGADIIVFEFPIFWYSWPSMLHRYVEEVFQHGFSHGTTGDKLKGKKLVLSFTTGAPAGAYTHDAMGLTVDDLFAPGQSHVQPHADAVRGRGAYLRCQLRHPYRRSKIREQEEVCRRHARRLAELLSSL